VSLVGKPAKDFHRLNIVAALVRSACVIKRARCGKTTRTEKTKDGEQAIEKRPPALLRSIASPEFVFVKRVRARVDFLITFTDTITVYAASHLDLLNSLKAVA
jgi:hypothetical protein